MKTYIYYHVGKVNWWKEQFKRQLDRIYGSALGTYADTIFIGAGSGSSEGGTGTELVDARQLRANCEVIVDRELCDYEYTTLLPLHAHAIEAKKPFKVLYIHTKGVTFDKSNERIKDWVELMEYFLVDGWKDCVSYLDTYDLVGVNWRNVPVQHFSGNFWWGRSDFIKTLPSPDRKIEQLSPLYKKAHHHKMGAEFWFYDSRPKVKCLHESNVEHYGNRYSPENYRSV